MMLCEIVQKLSQDNNWPVIFQHSHENVHGVSICTLYLWSFNIGMVIENRFRTWSDRCGGEPRWFNASDPSFLDQVTAHILCQMNTDDYYGH